MNIGVTEISPREVQRKAEKCFKDGYYCCEALVSTIRDEFKLDVPKEVVAMASGMAVGAGKSGCVCGAFNGFLVSYLNVQPMVATLILFSAARAIGLLLCNNMIVYVREDSFKIFGGYLGFIPTPIVVAAVCIIITSLILKKTALGLYVQSVGINKKASRIAGIKSERIIFLCYIVCGLCAILAVALGGNSLGGGKFRLTGSIIGAYTIQAITTTLYALGVSTEQAPVYKAVIVIIIVAIQAPPFKDYMKKMSAKRQLAKGGVA